MSTHRDPVRISIVRDAWLALPRDVFIQLHGLAVVELDEWNDPLPPEPVRDPRVATAIPRRMLLSGAPDVMRDFRARLRAARDATPTQRTAINHTLGALSGIPALGGPS